MSVEWRHIVRVGIGACRTTVLALLLSWSAMMLIGPAAMADEKKPAASPTTPLKPTQDLTKALDKAKSGATLTLGAGRFNGPLVVKNKTLTIQGQSGGGSVVYTDRADAVVIVTDGGKATIDDITIETGRDKRLAIYIKGGTVELNGCIIKGVNDDAVYIEAGTLDIYDCTFSDIAGSAIVAAAGATLDISNSEMRGIGQTGVSLGQAVKARISKTEIDALETVVAIGAADVAIENSALRSRATDKSGVYLDVKGPLAVEGNLIEGGVPALYAKASNDAAVRVSENLIMGSARGGIGIELVGAADRGPEITGNRIVIDGAEESSFGLLLRGATRAKLSDNRIVVRKGTGIVLQGDATASFAGNVVLADAATVAFVETDAASSHLESEILIPVNVLYGAPSLGEATKSFATALLEPAQFEAWKRLHDDAFGRTPDAPPPIETYRDYFATLDQQAGTLRNAAAAQARVALVVVDAIGHEEHNGFVLLDDQGNELSRHEEAPDFIATVAPGRYLVAPSIDPFNSIDVTVGAGETKVARLERRSALWLSFQPGSAATPAVRHLVTLAGPGERARAAALLRRPWLLDALPDRRPGASAGDMAAALELARAWLQGGRDAKRPPKDDNKGWTKWYQTDRMAYSIMALAGEASDVGWLTEFDKGNKLYWPGNSGVLAASLIEARLGRLNDGRFAEVARGDKGTAGIAAGLTLHRFGVRDHDQDVIDRVMMSSEPDYAKDYGYELLETMLDNGSAPALAAARRLLERYKQRQAELDALGEAERKDQYNNFAGARNLAVIHLLAHGSVDDWRLLVDEPIPAHVAATVAALAADPIEMMATLGALDMHLALYRYLSHLLTNRPSEAARMFELAPQYFYDIGYRAAFKDNRTNSDPQRVARQWINNFAGHSSALMPNEKAAEYYYKGAEGLNTDPMSWIDFGWKNAESVDLFLNGNASDNHIIQLDFIAHDELMKLFAEKNAAAALPDVELVLAYHKVASRAHRVLDLTNSGAQISASTVERRGFMVRKASTDKAYGGAISARLDVEPVFDGDTLKLRLKLPVASYYNELCTLAAKISTDCNKAAWLHHEFATNPRKLIAEVRLRRGDTIIPIVEEESESADDYVFSAAVGAHGTEDLWAEISIAFFEQRHEFSFPLFAGTFALEQRLAAAEIRRLEASPELAANDPTALVALGRARRVFGEPEASWQAFEMALGRDPNLVDLWFEGAEMFSAVGRPARAVEILGIALQTSPSDTNLLYALGVTAYRAKDYARAATAFGGVVARAPEDQEALQWRAHALFLGREWSAARDAYSALAVERRTPLIALLQTIASIEAATGQPADLASLDAARKAFEEAIVSGAASGDSGGSSIIGGLSSSTTDGNRACRDDFYGGYRLKFEAKRDKALAAFERAKQSCAAGSLEHRAAQTAVF